MNMAEAMQPGTNLFHSIRKGLTPKRLPATGLVKNAGRRGVGDQHICALGDRRPFLPQNIRRRMKGVTGQIRHTGRSVKRHTFVFDQLVL